MKQSFGRFFLELFSVLLFLVVAGTAVFFAYGYRFDVDEGEVQKTSIIDVAAPETQAQVYLDGEQKATVLPFQLKGVLPGHHDVIVRKEGFIPWSRRVEVQEDFVSIVRDVLLIPSDLGPYRSEVALFQEGQQFTVGKGYLLAKNPGSSSVRTIVFDRDGLIQDEEMTFYRSDFEVLDAFSDERLLLGFADDFYALLRLDSADFQLFSLPPSVEEVTVDIDGGDLYFLENNALYRTKVHQAPQERQFTFDPEKFERIHENVETFSIGPQGHLFFTSLGMLYRLDRGSDELKLVDMEPGAVTTLNVISGGDHEVLALQHHEQEMAFWVDEDGSLVEIASDVLGSPQVNNEVILYLDRERNLHVYDFKKEEDRLIRVLPEDEKVIGWFDNVGHFLVQHGTNISVEDIYNAHTVLLLEDVDPAGVFTRDGALFWLDGLQLMRLYWADALK